MSPTTRSKVQERQNKGNKRHRFRDGKFKETINTKISSEVPTYMLEDVMRVLREVNAELGGRMRLELER